MKNFLVFGLPGSGKTPIAYRIAEHFGAVHINADAVRTLYNDWDFSEMGRHRQAKRLAELKSDKLLVIDFVCPYAADRELFVNYFKIWVDTNPHESIYPDTRAIFQIPEAKTYDMRITHTRFDFDKILENIESPF